MTSERRAFHAQSDDDYDRTITRRGYADHMGADDARHNIAHRMRNVTVRTLESRFNSYHLTSFSPEIQKNVLNLYLGF